MGNRKRELENVFEEIMVENFQYNEKLCVTSLLNSKEAKFEEIHTFIHYHQRDS